MLYSFADGPGARAHSAARAQCVPEPKNAGNGVCARVRACARLVRACVRGRFVADTIAWGAIGARTTESQLHRELASGERGRETEIRAQARKGRGQ